MAEKYEPTQLQIRDCCRLIQEAWSVAERCRRAVWLHKDDLHASIPQFSHDDIRFASRGHSEGQ